LAGRHEPTKRSLYLSVTTWTLKRLLILAVAVVLGLVVLRNGFPSNASQGITGTPPTTPATTVSPLPPSPSPSPTSSPRVEGVVVQVLNGTSQTGLAANVSQTLEGEGYTVRAPDNAPSRQTTIIFYREEFLLEAQHMQQQFFPEARLRPAGTSVPRNVNLMVVLGADFLGSSPTP
jgi:hypothetical protein